MVTSGPDLSELYESTVEHLRYGVGALPLPEAGPAPLIQIHYTDWTREQLALVRSAMESGLVLSMPPHAGESGELYLCTVQRVTVHAARGGHTAVLHAPAWDARLTGLAESVIRNFQRNRRRLGVFVLVLQTPALGFLAVVNNEGGIELGPIGPRLLPIPRANGSP